MPVPGISDEKDLKPLLKKLLSDPEEVYQFAVAASGPREGQLVLDKKVKLKKKEVQQEAEAEAKKNGGKAVKMDVMTGECRLDATSPTTLRLIVYGKAPAKAVACVDHLLVRGPFKAIGFTGVILEEVEETADDQPAAPTTGVEAASDPKTDEQAAWTKMLAAIEPLYDKGIRARPDVASKLRAVMDFAKIKAEGKDFQAAIAGLEKVSELLRPAPTTGGGQTAAPTTKGPETDEARFKARVTDIKQQFDEIKAADPARAKPLAGLLMQAISLGQAKEFADAMLRLDKIEELLKGASATQPAESKTSSESAPATATPESLKDLQARLKSLLLRQKAIFEKAPDQRKSLLPFTLPATSLAPTGKPGAAEALDKLEEAIAAIEAQLAEKQNSAEATPKTTEEQPSAEPRQPATFEERIAEVEAAIGRLKPDNPFVADLRSRLQFLQNNRPEENDTRGWDVTNNNLSVLQERAAEALPFDKKLGLVQSLREKTLGDPQLGNLATELLERLSGVLSFARQLMPELGSRISQSMAELAALEQKARSGLPADVVKNLDELLALQDRADEVWARIDTVGDDDVRDKLLEQYRELTAKIPSSDAVTSDNLAEARELLATLEQQVKDALAAAAQESAASAAESDDSAATQDSTSAKNDEGTNATQALKAWNVTRDDAVKRLLAEIDVLVATTAADVGDMAPERWNMVKERSELELRAVVKQLRGNLETQRQAAEMARYLEQDEVVEDVCELTFDLATPLLQALNNVKVHLPA